MSWKEVTQYRSHGILGVSYKNIERELCGKYDLAIFFGSYESRGLLSSSLLEKHSCRKSLIILFKEKDEDDLRKKYDQVLIEQVNKCTKNETKIIKDISISHVENVFKKIFRNIDDDDYAENKKWLIDTSVSPKPYYLGILGYLRNKLQSPELTLFNATGNYEKGANPPEAYSFTEGSAEYIWIPWLWGHPDPRKEWIYFFLLGFEGDRSYAIYDQFEPRIVKALISNPGYTKGYTKIAEENNRQFLEESCAYTIFANAADAIQAWKIIDETVKEYSFDYNVCVIPLGPKPHAIGGCLSALTDGFKAVLYSQPKSYKVKDVPPGDYIWKYVIKI